MQTAILASLFLVLTAASYFAYPVFGISTEKPYEPEKPGPVIVAAQVDKPKPVVDPVEAVEPEPVKPEPVKPKPDKPIASNPPKPETPMAPTTPAKPAEPEVPVPDEDGFTPPVFQPIEKYVDDWKYIPPSVFPRDIRIEADVVCKSAIGGSTLRAGSPAVALSEKDGVLVIAPTATAPVRGEIAMEDTNLKEVMTKIYEQWKMRKIVTAKAAFLYKKNASVRKLAASQVSDTRKVNEAGVRPTQNADGTVPICIASMQAREVSEIKPAIIERWGQVEFEDIDGVKYWTVTVNYKSKTLFGTFDTEAQALIRNNRVEKWIYTGSGELVP